MTKIFPATPGLTGRHRSALAFGNEQSLRKWLRASRKPDDLKRAVLVELERGPDARQAIIHKLVIALQKAERREIMNAVMKQLTKKQTP